MARQDVASAASGLADIASVLESLDRPAEQLTHVLEIVGRFVPYDCCALLDEVWGLDQGLLAVPPRVDEARTALHDRMTALHRFLTEEWSAERMSQSLTPSDGEHEHLAVPVVVLDRIAGILLVESRGGGYDVHHLQLLSVVAAQLGGYLAKLRLQAEERKVARVSRRAAEFVEHVRDGLLEFDADGVCVSANPAARELFAGGERLIGASAEEIFGAAEATFSDAIRRALKERASLRLEAVHVPGRDRWWRGEVYPTELGVSVFIRDVTERRRAEESRDLLVGIIGHDLGTPLAAVTMTAEALLQREGLDEDVRRAITRISLSGARMRELVSQLLDFTRLRVGRTVPIRRRPADLGRICRHAVDEVARSHPGRSIEPDIEDELEGMWDADRLAQVVSNLLDNAVKHGDPSAPVRLRAEATADDEVCVSVHNSGPPISEDQLPTIFEAFREGDRRASEDSSFGLGLFIVKSIVDAHGGSIDVVSTKREGTTFTVCLPRGPHPHENASEAGEWAEHREDRARG